MRRLIHRRGLSTTHIVLIVVGIVLLTSCLVITVFASLLLPALAKARDSAKVAASMVHVQAIIQQVDQFAQSTGQPPATIQASSPFGPVVGGMGQSDYWVDFSLRGARCAKEGATLIVCIDRAMMAADRPSIVVGYADGHAATVDRAVVEQFLRAASSGPPPSTQPSSSP